MSFNPPPFAVAPPLPPAPPALPPPSGLPWLMRRGLGLVMLASSLLIPGCVAVFS